MDFIIAKNLVINHLSYCLSSRTNKDNCLGSSLYRFPFAVSIYPSFNSVPKTAVTE